MTFAADYREFRLVRPEERLSYGKIMERATMNTSRFCHLDKTPSLTTIADKTASPFA